MDLSQFFKAAVAGVPIVFVVIGVVYWFKKFKRADGSQTFTDNSLLVISMLVGLVVGGGYMLSQSRPPSGDWWDGWVYWFALAVYGLGMGIIASGLYSEVKAIIEKWLDKQAALIAQGPK